MHDENIMPTLMPKWWNFELSVMFLDELNLSVARSSHCICPSELGNTPTLNDKHCDSLTHNTWQLFLFGTCKDLNGVTFKYLNSCFSKVAKWRLFLRSLIIDVLAARYSMIPWASTKTYTENNNTTSDRLKNMFFQALRKLDLLDYFQGTKWNCYCDIIKQPSLSRDWSTDVMWGFKESAAEPFTKHQL
jgi:hypothetical protein